jgi:hypothetical protein
VRAKVAANLRATCARIDWEKGSFEREKAVFLVVLEAITRLIQKVTCWLERVSLLAG